MPAVEDTAHRRVVRVLVPLSFAAGASALAWQLLWVRELELVFGASSEAIATVLAVFLGGLALGGRLASRRADRVARPLRAYALVELAVAAWGLAFPWLVRGLTPAWLAWPAEGALAEASGAARAVLVGAALLPACVLLGASFPLLARFVVVELDRAGARASTFVGAHGSGAALGAFLCGFVWLPRLGQDGTTTLVAAIHATAAALALGLDRLVGRPDLDAPAELVPAPAGSRPLLVAVALAGFAALAHQVAWNRLLTLVLGASVYTYATQLVTVLAGLALGGLLGGPLGDRALRRRGAEGPLLAFGAVEGALALCAFALLYAWPELPVVYVRLFEALGRAPDAHAPIGFALAALVAFVPAVLMGARLPVAARALLGPGTVGGRVGAVWGAEALGSAVGVAVATLALVPWLGMQQTAMLAVALDLLAAALVVLDVERRTRFEFAALPPLALVTLILAFRWSGPGWDPLWMTAATWRYAGALGELTRDGIAAHAVEGQDLLFYEEGPASTVTLARLGPTEHVWLASDGVLEASSVTDRPTEVLLAALPVQFTDHPDRALVVGLGSGVTAGVLARVEAVDRVDVVEIEPAMQRAAPWFGDLNHDVLMSRKVRLVTDDARAHVLRAPAATWDVVINAPSAPWVPGASGLYTREFYELGKTRLTNGGIWAQWIPVHGLGPEELRSLLRTFAEVFPNVLVYATIEEADLVLVGSDAPLVRSTATAQRLARSPIVQDLAAVGIQQAADLVVKNLFARDGILTLAGDVRLNTDSHRFVAYAAPLRTHLDDRAANWALLMAEARPATDILPPDPQAWADLARAYQARRDTPRAVATMLQAIEHLPPSSPSRDDWLAEAKRWQTVADRAKRDKEGPKEAPAEVAPSGP